jgi:hypothetical protein
MNKITEEEYDQEAAILDRQLNQKAQYLLEALDQMVNAASIRDKLEITISEGKSDTYGVLEHDIMNLRDLSLSIMYRHKLNV